MSRDVQNCVTAVPLAIDANSHEPAYLQIVRQIRRLIASGSLKPGDALPSARAIARTLTVNPMTASKAIQRLADEGVLARRRGMTMTVVALSQPELVPGGVVEAALRVVFGRALDEALQLRIPPDTITEVFLTLVDERQRQLVAVDGDRSQTSTAGH